MTKRRKRLLALSAVFAVLGTLALPPVHWRLIGWTKGEPFWKGRPTSYWRGEVLACEATPWYGCSLTEIGAPPRPNLVLTRRTGPLDHVVQQLADLLGTPGLSRLFDSPVSDCDASAVPVLTTLLGDSDPKVRYYSVQSLGYLGEAGLPALPVLRGLSEDRAEVIPGVAVADAVPFALFQIEKPLKPLADELRAIIRRMEQTDE